jgi:hypothetical protein
MSRNLPILRKFLERKSTKDCANDTEFQNGRDCYKNKATYWNGPIRRVDDQVTGRSGSAGSLPDLELKFRWLFFENSELCGASVMAHDKYGRRFPNGMTSKLVSEHSRDS